MKIRKSRDLVLHTEEQCIKDDRRYLIRNNTSKKTESMKKGGRNNPVV